jgi:hypothetical protein
MQEGQEVQVSMTETIFRCHQGVEDGSNLILTIIYYTKCLPSLRNGFCNSGHK